MKYKINSTYEIIVNGEITALFTGEVDKVFVLNKIESKIFKQFESPKEPENAYEDFSHHVNDVVILKEDYLNFFNQLIEKNLIIESND